MSNGFTSIFSLQSLLPIFTVAIFTIVIIIGFDCIWRVEKRLNLFFKTLVSGFIVITLRMALGITGLSEATNWSLIVWATNLVAGILFLSAMVVMYRFIRSLNREKPARK